MSIYCAFPEAEVFPEWAWAFCICLVFIVGVWFGRTTATGITSREYAWIELASGEVRWVEVKRLAGGVVVAWIHGIWQCVGKGYVMREIKNQEAKK
jgi:hypothetical protein